jgi:hypothetical protein
MSSEENKSVQVQLEELRKKQGELAKRQDEMGRDIGHLQADARLQRVVVAGLKGAFYHWFLFRSPDYRLI